MHVEVRFHPDCLIDLADWLRRLPGVLEDRRLLLGVVIDELKAELIRTLGRPQAARFVPTPPPPSYLWLFARGCVVRYRSTDAKGWFRQTRHVEIVSLLPAWPS